MRYFVILFLFCRCGCIDIKGTGKPAVYTGPHNKYYTIINHTNKTYRNNCLYSLGLKKLDGKWILRDYSPDKIHIIKPGEKINKNEKGKSLELEITYSEDGYEQLFLLSLGNLKKLFFGAYDYHFKYVWGEVTSDCKRSFIKYDVHPVWQEKELTIHIYNDKITFSDPKIKEVKRLRLSYDEYADPNTLELVDCSKE